MPEGIVHLHLVSELLLSLDMFVADADYPPGARILPAACIGTSPQFESVAAYSN